MEREMPTTAALNQELPCLDWYWMPESLEDLVDYYRASEGMTRLQQYYNY
jgi:hypothetical protein